MAEARLSVAVSTKGAVKAEKELNNLAKTSKVVDINVKKTGKTFKSFGSSAAKAVQAIDGPLGGISSRITAITGLANGGAIAFAGLAASVVGFSFALTSGVQELDKLNIGLAKSEALIRATGGAAGFTALQLQDQAQALAQATLASVEGVQKAQGILQTYNRVSAGTFTEAITLAQDLAAVYGGDVATQTTLIGKALQDPIKGITALNRVGVTFTGTQREQIDLFIKGGDAAKAQGIILANLASQVGGAGSAVSDESLAGALDFTGQLYDNFVAKLADSSGTYSGVVGLVNKLNDALIVNGQLADENSDRNFQALVSERRALQAEIKELEGSFFSASRGEADGKRDELSAVTAKIKKIQDLNIKKAKDATAAAKKGEEVQAANRKADLKEQEKLAADKAAKIKIAEDKKLARSKATAQKELETLLNINNTEIEAINVKLSKRLAALQSSRNEELISEMAFQDAITEVVTNAEIARGLVKKTQAEADEEARKKQVEGTLAGIKSVSDGLIDAAASGGDMGDAVKGAFIGIAKQAIKSGIDMLVAEQIVDKVATTSKVGKVTAETSSKVLQAGLNAFAAGSETSPIVAAANAAAATGVASGMASASVAAMSAREQGGSLSAGQSSTVAERGQLEILTPSSSSRIRTKQQMQQLMGGESNSAPTINVVNINQSNGPLDIETTTDDDGRIINLIRSTNDLDISNANSSFRKNLAAHTTTEARR